MHTHTLGRSNGSFDRPTNLEEPAFEFRHVQRLDGLRGDLGVVVSDEAVAARAKGVAFALDDQLYDEKTGVRGYSVADLVGRMEWSGMSPVNAYI